MLTSPTGKSYIGQTTRHIEKRLEEHRTGKSSDCVAIYNAIQLYGWDNFEKEWYECPDNDLNKHEELMIEVLGTLSPDGYNLKEGGGNGKLSEESKQKMRESQLGKTLSEETKQKMSESRLGIPLAEGHKQNIREARLGIPHTDERKQNISEALLGRTLTSEHKQNISEAQRSDKNHKSKRVYQYDLEGVLLGSFACAEEAARHLNKTCGSSITACARGNPRNKTAYGFKWSHEKI